jgi:hypothetical protein
MCSLEETIRAGLLNTLCRNILVLNNIIPSKVTGIKGTKSLEQYEKEGWVKLAMVKIASTYYYLVCSTESILMEHGYDVRWCISNPGSNAIHDEDIKFTELDFDFPSNM